jgi:splicing factor 3A subunit 3
MLLEEQRYIAEDLERLEQGVADRIGEEPNAVRDARSLAHPPNTFHRRSS